MSTTTQPMATPETAPLTVPTSRTRAFVQHYAPTVMGQGLILGLGVLTGILSARMLGPVGRGEFAAINIWPMAIITLLSMGMNQAIAFHVGRRVLSVHEVATATLVIGLAQSLIAVAVGLLVVPIALAKYPPTVQHLASLFVLFTPALIFSGYPANLFQGLPDLLRFNLIRVVAPLAYMAGLVAIYFEHRANVANVVYAQVGGYVLALVIGLGMVAFSLRPHLRWNRSAVPSMLSFGSRTQATNLTNYFNQRIDQLVLSLFVPAGQLGYYAVAVTLSTAVTVFPQAAGIITFSHGSGQSPEVAKNSIRSALRASIAWLLPVCIALYLLTPFLINHVFGRAFGGSILACRILLPGAFMIGLNQVLYNGASALGRPGLPSIAEGISMAVTAIGLFLLVPHYGYIGAAIVSTIAYTLSFVVMLVLAHKLLNLRVGFLFKI